MEASTLVFPGALREFRSDRSAIRGQLRDTFNRLQSIAEDAGFIEDEVRLAYPEFPVVANQRAGSWYVRPGRPTAHAYFKSTDGHAGQHHFNLRRANLVLLPVISHHHGIVLVDSTRRGKRFPDALSKTIPLWCAVINAARMKLLPPTPENSPVDLAGWERDGVLWTLSSAIGRSEHEQIRSNVAAWAEALLESSYDLSAITSLTKPLRPIFISPSSILSESPASAFPDFFPVVCASASKMATESDGMERAKGYTYVQGSGDDHESWSNGLTADVFWGHSDTILTASRDECDSVIASILSSLPSSSSPTSDSTPIRTTRISLAFATESPSTPSPTTSTIFIQPTLLDPAPSLDSSTRTLIARMGKKGYHAFFASLEPALAFAEEGLRSDRTVEIVTGVSESQSDANDLGIAVALVLLVRLFNDEAQLRPLDTIAPPTTKPIIRTRLQWILEAIPSKNPSRNILTAVNNYLMSSPTYR